MTVRVPKNSNLLDRETTDQLETVSQRIAKRLKILEAWRSEGIPDGKILPRSLNAARMWHDDEIGIQPINSPNDFTTTHAEHGTSVKKIGDLLAKLASRYGRPKKTVSKASTGKGINHTANERALAETVSQWHRERDQHLSERRRANAAEKRSTALLEENAEKDRLIADLRRQLSSSSGLRVVE